MKENQRVIWVNASLFLFFRLYLLLIGGGSLTAQTIWVTQGNSGEGVEAVSIISGQKGVLTDSLGKASLEVFTPGDSLRFRHISFESLTLSWEQIQNLQFQVALQETSVELAEVSILFNRWEQRRSEIANYITQISETEIQLQQPQTSADLLGLSGEVFVQKSQQGGGSPMIRGFSANRVLLVIDGVRMNNAIYRSGNLHNVISLDPFSLAQTEVIFGPGSVVYGSDALGGVMDFHTLKPRYGKDKLKLISGSASLRFASANQEQSGHVDINMANSKWSWLTSLSYSDFDDLTMGRHGRSEYLRNDFVGRQNGEDVIVSNSNPRKQISSGYRQINLLQKLYFKPSDSWEFGYDFHYSRSSDIPRYDRLIEELDELPRKSEWYYGPQIWQMHKLHADYSSSNSLFDKVQIALAYQNFQESRNDRDFQQVDLRTRSEEVKIGSFSIDAKKSIGQDLTLFYGTELFGNWVSSTGTSQSILSGESRSISSRYPDGATWHAFAAYLNGLKKIDPTWTLSMGVRYNHISLQAPFDLTFFDFPFTSIESELGALNGSIGIIFHPHKQWQFNANVASGFRAPNIDDIGKVFDSEPGNVIVPNPDLKPEYAYTADVGILYNWGEKSELSINAFYTWLENAIVRRDLPFNGQDSILFDGVLSKVQADVNADKAQIYGLQVRLQMHLQPWLQFRSTFSWMEGEDSDGFSLRHVSPNFGTTHFIFQQKAFSMDLYGTFNGEISATDLAPTERPKTHIYASDESGNPFSPSWYTLNAKAQYQFPNEVNLQVGWENITDQRYRPYSSGIAAAGSNWIIGVRKGL